MSTLMTRSLGKTDRFDRRAVRVEAEAFKGKFGIITVTVASYVVAANAGDVEVRVPNFDPNHDDYLVSDTNGAGGTVAVGKKVHIAVNNGIPGPSVQVNGDGTWDLLWLTYALPADTELEGVSVTLDYTVEEFLDLTPSSSNPSTGNETLTLSVGPQKTSDAALIGIADAEMVETYGYIKSWVNDIDVTLKGASQGVLPPVFAVYTGESGGCGCSTPYLVLVEHYVAKVSGPKVYAKGLFIHAVNNGKIDANGGVNKGTNSQSVALTCKLDGYYPQEVTVAVNYNISFTSLSV